MLRFIKASSPAGRKKKPEEIGPCTNFYRALAKPPSVKARKHLPPPERIEWGANLFPPPNASAPRAIRPLTAPGICGVIIVCIHPLNGTGKTGIGFRYEKNVSTQQPQAEKETRFSRPHEIQGRQKGFKAPAHEGPNPLGCLGNDRGDGAGENPCPATSQFRAIARQTRNRPGFPTGEIPSSGHAPGKIPCFRRSPLPVHDFGAEIRRQRATKEPVQACCERGHSIEPGAIGNSPRYLPFFNPPSRAAGSAFHC